MENERDRYADFRDFLHQTGQCYSITIDARVSREEFGSALLRARSDADSFWQHASSTRQALALMETHVEEIVATTKSDTVVLIVDPDGYLARQK